MHRDGMYPGKFSQLYGLSRSLPVNTLTSIQKCQVEELRIAIISDNSSPVRSWNFNVLFMNDPCHMFLHDTNGVRKV